MQDCTLELDWWLVSEKALDLMTSSSLLTSCVFSGFANSMQI